MSASYARPPIAASVVPVQAELRAMWRAQPGAFMLLGQASGPVPKTGSARMASVVAGPGVFRTEFWPLKGEAGHAFLAAVSLPHAADRADSAELLLRGARGADRDLRLALPAASGEPAFGKQVAALAGAHAARILRFMLDVLKSEDGSDMRQPTAVLDAFLSHAARPAGCVELIMHVPRSCVLLQGWGAPSVEPVSVLLPGSPLSPQAALSAAFAREDIAAPATGSVIVLPPDVAGAMVSLEKVFLLTGDDLLCRRVVEPRLLDAEASIGQIRHLLPRLDCPAPMQALLRATLQPRYEGRDTLNAAGRPVRAALDTAVTAAGGGAYLSGWLFDPGDHMAELHLCADGVATRLDESWVRVPREDVCVAFRADPAFPPPSSDEAGFAVAVPVAPGQAAYLRFTFADGDLAFMPIRFADAGIPAVLNAMLASVDLHKPSGISIVARHLAPFVAQIPAPRGACDILLRGPLDRARAIVVLLRQAALPRSFVSGFLLDPPASDEQVVFVVGPEWNPAQRDALLGLVQFYQVPATVIAVGHTPRPVDAIRDVAALTDAESFLLASPGLVGGAPGWRASLDRAAGDDRVACPTVLFEDRSLRFAGSTTLDFSDRAPFVTVRTSLAGACADLVGPEPPRPADGGTLACCLIRRAALPALADASRFMTEAGQEAAFFLALREAGMPGTWVPAVRVSAPEEPVNPAVPTLPLIDGWMLRNTWGEARRCAS